VTVLGSATGLADTLREMAADVVHLHGTGFSEATIRELEAIDRPAIVTTDNFGWPNRSGVDHLVDRYYFISDMTRIRWFKLFDVPRVPPNLRKYQRLYYPLAQVDIQADSTPTFREQFGIDPDTPVIGKISRQDARYKWSNVSLDAFERVIETRPDTVFLLVNPVPEVESAIEERGLADNCHYIDFIHPRDVYTFYDSIDVLGHSSRIGESFGYVVAEALARGTPAVVNSTPMRDNEQIELVDHGETGYVATSDHDFAAAILDLLKDDDKREQFSRRASERAAERYGPDVVTRKLEREYLRVIGEASPEYQESEIDLTSSEAEYRRRLHRAFGTPSWKHRLERAVWTGVSGVLPRGRYTRTT
jgi:glycosyltransferase involved in cell wall biosynthesis